MKRKLIERFAVMLFLAFFSICFHYNQTHFDVDEDMVKTFLFVLWMYSCSKLLATMMSCFFSDSEDSKKSK